MTKKTRQLICSVKLMLCIDYPCNNFHKFCGFVKTFIVSQEIGKRHTLM